MSNTDTALAIVASLRLLFLNRPALAPAGPLLIGAASHAARGR